MPCHDVVLQKGRALQETGETIEHVHEALGIELRERVKWATASIELKVSHEEPVRDAPTTPNQVYKAIQLSGPNHAIHRLEGKRSKQRLRSAQGDLGLDRRVERKFAFGQGGWPRTKERQSAVRGAERCGFDQG